MATLRRLLDGALDLVFPPRCIGCERWGTLLCPTCQRALPRLLPPFCSRCCEPFGGPLDHTEPALCARCRERPLTIAGIRAPYLMEGTVRRAILELKYQGMTSLAAPLGGLLGGYWKEQHLEADLIVPVPLHARRQRQRGFNQAALLAQAVGRNLRIAVALDALERVRNSPAQAKAESAHARHANVQGAFRARPGVGLQGARVLVIDDVCTTGATLESCAQALKAAGASKVWGLTLARER